MQNGLISDGTRLKSQIQRGFDRSFYALRKRHTWRTSTVQLNLSDYAAVEFVNPRAFVGVLYAASKLNADLIEELLDLHEHFALYEFMHQIGMYQFNFRHLLELVNIAMEDEKFSLSVGSNKLTEDIQDKIRIEYLRAIAMPASRMVRQSYITALTVIDLATWFTECLPRKFEIGAKKNPKYGNWGP